MQNKILIGHNLTKGGGMTFICTEHGTAREFETVADARKHITDYLDARIWSILLLTECPQ